ncbi:uncharacterized protein LOC111109276 isoform X2 [Crassostrea virginica]
MYSYSSKRKREDDLLAVPSLNRRQGMDVRTSPVISGTYVEVEPRHQRFVPSTVGSGYQSSGATRMPDRVGLYETTGLLSDDQIQRFISTTVLPHHRTLTNSEGVSWSQAPPDNRPAPPKKIKTGANAYPNRVEDLQRRQVPQGNPVLISVPQGAQRGFQGNIDNHYLKTQGTPTGFPRELSVLQERQEFLIPQETNGKAFSIPLSTGTQAVSVNQEDITNQNCIDEEIIKFPQGIQDKIISSPQGSQGKISRAPMLTTEEYDILQDIIVTNEGKEETVDLPQGTLSLSRGTRGLEETEDDIIVHQGTPEDLIRVVQETLQEIMGINHGNSISQGTAEEVMGIPNKITVYDESGKEITGFSTGTVEEIMGITQEIMIPQGSVEEIMGIPQGNTIPQETLHEIMGIMATVPDETLQEIMGFPHGIVVLQGINVPEGIDIPTGTQGQASPVHYQNKCKGNNGVGCQDQQSFWKSHSEMVPTIHVITQHQPMPSYNQSMQTMTPQTVPVREKSKQNHLFGGTTQGQASDHDPLRLSLSLPTNASWGGNSELQNANERCLVEDTMNYDQELNGVCRKRRREASSEDTSRKRQRRDQTTNLDTGNNQKDAGLMILPERSPENEEFFASIDKCLEMSSENIPSKEKCTFLDDLDNASLETFPSKVIDDIYKSTFESDCFLVSDDDFVTDSLAFLKQGGDFGLGGLW